MAARKQRSHVQAVRDRIRTSQLVNRLQANALGKLKRPMTPEQITSATVLLDRTLPRLKQVELSGELATNFPGVHIHPPK